MSREKRLLMRELRDWGGNAQEEEKKVEQAGNELNGLTGSGVKRWRRRCVWYQRGLASGGEEMTVVIVRKDETEGALLRCHESAAAPGF